MLLVVRSIPSLLLVDWLRTGVMTAFIFVISVPIVAILVTV
ncbi:hypothetical protein PPOLYM_03529 [Paenibacillus polymyxa]|nr:hypothetical protein PPOLYM_03529 [Paenibacillus polymyxa]